MSDKDQDKDKKPDLKVIDFTKKKEELEKTIDDYDIQLKETYITARIMFHSIQNPEYREEALDHLKRAFLIAMDPMQDFDPQIDEHFEDLEDEEEYE